MLLLDALRQAECSICLQAFFSTQHSSASPTPNTTPQKTLQPKESLQIYSPESSAREAMRQAPGQSEGESGFRIVFAPGVQEAERNSDLFARVKEREENALRAGDEESIVVLPCGHFLHFHCGLQLYEYKHQATCPICRQSLDTSADLVVFSPQQRPRRFTSSPAHDCDGAVETVATEISEDNDNASDSEVEVTGARDGTAVAAYMQHLERMTNECRRRRQTIRSREKHLTASKEELRDQCQALEQFLTDTKRRFEVLSQGNGVGAERLMELRETAADTNASLNCLTAELAASMRDQQTLDRQLEKYRRKLSQLRGGDEVGVKRRTEDNAAERQPQKRHRSTL